MRERTSVQTVERDLRDALQRLEVGTPNNLELRGKARRGVLRINPSTVAKEAGHSRTLISHDHCAYPDIREEILRHASVRKPQKDPAETRDQLRKEVAELRRALRISREERVAILLRMKKVEQKAINRIGIAERRAARTSKEANEIGGKWLGMFSDELEVIEINHE